MDERKDRGRFQSGGYPMRTWPESKADALESKADVPAEPVSVPSPSNRLTEVITAIRTEVVAAAADSHALLALLTRPGHEADLARTLVARLETIKGHVLTLAD